MTLAVAGTVIELVNGIKGGDAFSLQGGKLRNFMPQGIAASLQQEAEEGVASTIDQLLLYLGMVDQCLVPKQEHAHLSHFWGGGVGGEFGGELERCLEYLGYRRNAQVSYCSEKTACYQPQYKAMGGDLPPLVPSRDNIGLHAELSRPSRHDPKWH